MGPAHPAFIVSAVYSTGHVVAYPGESMARQPCRHIVTELSDDRVQVISLPLDYDLSRGLPTSGGKTFETIDEAIEELAVRMQPDWEPGQ